MGRHSVDIVGNFKLKDGEGFTVGSFDSNQYRKEFKKHKDMGLINEDEHNYAMQQVAQLVHMVHYMVIKLEQIEGLHANNA